MRKKEKKERILERACPRGPSRFAKGIGGGLSLRSAAVGRKPGGCLAVVMATGILSYKGPGAFRRVHCCCWWRSYPFHVRLPIISGGDKSGKRTKRVPGKIVSWYNIPPSPIVLANIVIPGPSYPPPTMASVLSVYVTLLNHHPP